MNDVIHNERTKLTAAWLNTVACGITITGVVAPLIATYLNLAGTSQIGALPLIVTSASGLAAGLVLHYTGRPLLGSLK